MIRTASLAGMALLGGLVAYQAPANATIVFTGAQGSDTAEVDFTVSGSTLSITLKDTSSAASYQYQNADLLTGLFFDVNGTTPTLTSGTASAVNGVFNSASCTTTCTATPLNVGGEWTYQYSSTGYTAGSAGKFATTSQYGLAAMAFGGTSPSFNTSSNTPSGPAAFVTAGATHYGPSVAPDGSGFSIVGPNYSLSNTAVTPPGGSGPQPELVKSEIDFTFQLSSAITESEIDNVVFAFGADPGVPTNGCAVNCSGTTTGSSVPEPASLAILGMGLMGLGSVVRRKRS